MTSQRPVHLLVCVHGMWGNPNHVAELARIIREAKAEDLDTELDVLVAATNSEESTYDGIDWGGERVLQEVTDRIAEIETTKRTVTKFSAVGYSFGGLVLRYMIGIMYARQFFEKVAPVNFTTFATPHIGVPRYPTFISGLFATLGPRFLSRTGEQFYGVDKWSPSGRSLLEVMADPSRIFYQALELFPHLTIYANTVNDVTVPYVTGAIELEDPFLTHVEDGMIIELDESCPNIIKSWRLPDIPPPKPKKPTPLSIAWFKSAPIPLPPPLQFRFPFNIGIYLMLPLLIPAFMSMAVVRLSASSRRSRKRIHLLEKDESYADRFVHYVASMEKRMEDAVVDLTDDDTPVALAPTPGPRLTPAQRAMVVSLNKLSRLEKVRVFIHPLRNSHATIVSRDVANFEFHKIGWGIIGHWADRFEL